jgi:predicted amidohydrolase
VRIALIQQTATEDKNYNVRRGLEALATAAREGAHMVAFAELGRQKGRIVLRAACRR